MYREGTTLPALRPSDITHHNFDLCTALLEEEVKYIFSEMGSPGFAGTLLPYPGAEAFVRELQSVGDVVAVTTPFAQSLTWAYDRTQWLKGIGIDKVVLVDEKRVVRGDILIEDFVTNMPPWLAENPGGVGILLQRPWNASEMSIAVRADGYSQALSAVYWVARLGRRASPGVS
jgi:5'(3')-deoxyribonucleotidase